LFVTIRGVRAGLLALAMWALGCACARADAGVLLREVEGLRPTLCGALRIQLSGAAEVECEADEGPDELAGRISRAAERVRAEGARLGVLLERDPDPRRVRMYLVSAEGDQAVVAIERIEDRADPDVDRSLALKVRDAYDVVQVVEKTAPRSPAPLSGALASPAAKAAHREAAAVPPPGLTRIMFLDAGGGASFGARTHYLGVLTLGFGALGESYRAELGVGGRFASRSDETRSFGQATVLARGPQLSLRALWRGSRFEAGAALDVIVWYLRGQGVASDGTRGTRIRLSPALSVGPDLRVRLFSSAQLRFAPALELATVSQTFAVEQRVLVDEGLVRVVLPLSLHLSLPLREPESFRP
jgi:hypothetical protein